MIFNVHVNPGSSFTRVQEQGKNLKVYLTKRAYSGIANKQLIDLLSAHFKIKKYQIKIKSGEKSRNKLVEISDAGV
jgi:uncharacterized protein